jgi:hypothetical protein
MSLRKRDFPLSLLSTLQMKACFPLRDLDRSAEQQPDRLLSVFALIYLPELFAVKVTGVDSANQASVPYPVGWPLSTAAVTRQAHPWDSRAEAYSWPAKR